MTREKLIEIIAQTEDNDNWSEYLADRIRAAYAKESQIAEPTVAPASLIKEVKAKGE